MQQLQLLRNFSGSVYLLGHLLYMSASAYEMSEQRVCGGGDCEGGGGGVQRITVTQRGREWTVCMCFFSSFEESKCVCVALP